jgi:hypothetical protein
MDLKEAWKILEKEKLTKPVTGTIGVPNHSKHPVANIILTYALALGFCVFFELIFVSLLFTVDQTIVKAGVVLMILIYGFLIAMNWRVLQKLKQLHHSDENVLNVLHGVLAIVTQTIKFQQKISWGFFPFCVAGGFVLGVSMKNDAATMMTQPKFYITLIITMAIVTPACYFLMKWLTKISYGKYLKQIEGLIQQTKGD